MNVGVVAAKEEVKAKAAVSEVKKRLSEKEKEKEMLKRA